MSITQSIWHAITAPVVGTWHLTNTAFHAVEAIPYNLVGIQTDWQMTQTKKALEDEAKSLVKKIDAKNAEIKTNDKKLADYTTAQQQCSNGTDPVSINGTNTPCSVVATQLQAAKTKKQKLAKELTDLTTQYQNVEAKLGVVTKSVQDTGGNKGDKGGGNGGLTTAQLVAGGKDAWKGKYKYNAPMVKEAYFTKSYLQKHIIDNNYVDQGNFSDALNAWRLGMGGRGVIQQDRVWLRTVINQPKADPQLVKRLNTSYGFKFHYNPSSVSQAWGVQSVADPVWLSQQSNLAIQPVTMNLSSAVVDFQIILNRLEDHTHLDDEGNFAGFDPSTVDLTGLKGAPTAVVQSVINAARDKYQKTFNGVNNPYPTFVPLEDRAEIVKRGTMYDIEYLFKTIMSPLKPFEGALNGVTSDRAYLQPAIVELHLGDALRYRARIEKFSINHIVFSPKMVPLFTTVSLSMSRFVDSEYTNSYEEKNFTAQGTPNWNSLQR